MTVYLCTKFDNSSFSRSSDIMRATKNVNRSRDLTTPLSGMVGHQWARTCYDQPV